MGVVISIMNPKGGVGKTTISIHLARYFQLAGMDTVLIDADPQGSALDWASVGATPLPCLGVRHETMASTLAGVAKSYDIIVVDGAAKLDPALIVPTLRVSDVMIIPVQPSALDIWGCADLAELARIRMDLAGKPVTHFLINRQIVNTALATDVGQALETQGLPLLSSRLSQRVAYAEAIAAGATVLDYEPGGKAAGEINALGFEVSRHTK